MTNSELLQTAPALLSQLDQQRRYILQIYLTPVPCPNPGCARPVHQFQARGYVDVDQWDLRDERPDPDTGFTCPHCHYKLRRIVPLFAVGPSKYLWAIDEPLPAKTLTGMKDRAE